MWPSLLGTLETWYISNKWGQQPKWLYDKGLHGTPLAILAMFESYYHVLNNVLWNKASCDAGHVSALGLCSELADQEHCDSANNYASNPNDSNDAIEQWTYYIQQDDLTILWFFPRNFWRKSRSLPIRSIKSNKSWWSFHTIKSYMYLMPNRGWTS